MFALSSLLVAAAIFAAAIRYLPFSWNQPKPLTLSKNLQPVLIANPNALAPVTDEAQSGFVDPSPLAVRDIALGKATVLVRYRSSKKTATGQLIIWAGKRRGLHDSYYDLGVRPTVALGDKIVAEFVQMGRDKLAELEALGTAKRASRKRVAAPAVESATTELIAVSSEQVFEEAASAEAVEPEQTVAAKQPVPVKPTPQPKRFPSITRGYLMHAGLLDKASGDSTKKVYGVVLKDEDQGKLVTLWGSDLRGHVDKLGLKLSDKIEVIKLGRQMVDPNKAPMNLYSVAKLSS